ncbi:uncharacterized protein BDV17DRAFT_13284 [Aspergillus undulatus]|uniref:uncharacterized protein n=1 Tax=Aspergillus undulatus TaxID=1810928 RepID=UPI003CCDE264
MRTNLSRHSVAFSDLSWETALGTDTDGVPVFPHAWQVRRYLEKYAEFNIPSEYLKFGARVLQVSRRGDCDVGLARGRWEVSWVDDGNEDTRYGLEDSIQKDEFDFLVVASGHFGTPDIPQIPGLDSFPNAIHSSELQSKEDISRLLSNTSSPAKLVVVGGSLSGVEAATSLALHLSSLTYGLDSHTHGRNAYEVVHVAPGPFWVLPRYLPRRQPEKSPNSMEFVPLDLSLYDLERRSQGLIEFSFGPVSPDQVTQSNEFFRTMLGQDYSQNGGFNFVDDGERASDRPPWTSIADYYAGFVRSGAIKVLTGRALSIDESEHGNGTISLDMPSGSASLTNAAAIIMATGFKPSESLSFLPQDVLSTLEYSKEDHSMPLVLDRWSSGHSGIKDLGFVGFYRGAFWGPAELQAQVHADTWAALDLENEASASLLLPEDEQHSRAVERQRVRALRNLRPVSRRGQFVLGDYVGLMESLARKLGRRRLPIRPYDGVSPTGPVVPVRYASTVNDEDTAVSRENSAGKEVEISMAALRGTHVQSSTSIAAAIFRALHGQWIFKRTNSTHGLGGREIKTTGKATFHPRYPSCPDHEAEYLCEEVQSDKLRSIRKSVYRFRGSAKFMNLSGIRVWSVDNPMHSNAATGPPLEVHMSPSGELLGSGDIKFLGTANPTQPVRHTYEFYFDRVAITNWQHVVYTHDYEMRESSTCMTRYSKPVDASHSSSVQSRPRSLL